MDFPNLSLPLLLTRVLYTLAHSSCRLKEVKVSRYYLGLSGGVTVTVDVRGWDCLTDLGPLIFWLLDVN